MRPRYSCLKGLWQTILTFTALAASILAAGLAGAVCAAGAVGTTSTAVCRRAMCHPETLKLCPAVALEQRFQDKPSRHVVRQETLVLKPAESKRELAGKPTTAAGACLDWVHLILAEAEVLQRLRQLATDGAQKAVVKCFAGLLWQRTRSDSKASTWCQPSRGQRPLDAYEIITKGFGMQQPSQAAGPKARFQVALGSLSAYFQRSSFLSSMPSAALLVPQWSLLSDSNLIRRDLLRHDRQALHEAKELAQLVH